MPATVDAGWTQKQEDGDGVRAMEVVVPECDEENSMSCKERGNWHFKRAEYDDALSFYTKAIKLNQGGKSALNTFHKNRAACYIKIEDYDSAIKDSVVALGYNPNDSKALFRKVQALELKNDLAGAYVECKRLFQMDRSNKAIHQMITRLRDRVELTHIQERSTENKVNKMFDIAFDTKKMDKGKKKIALNNLIYLSRDDAGAERIFQEGGLNALNELLQENDEEYSLPAIRALDGVLGNHKARCHQALLIIGHEKIRELLASENEDLSNATMSTAHRIVQSLKSDVDPIVRHMNESVLPEVSNDLAKFYNMFIDMMLDRQVSKYGRDNVLTLLAKNVPRDDVKGATNERVLKFMELKGIERLLSLASRTYNVEKSPVPISPNTRSNCAVCLAKFYDDMGGDQARLEYSTRAEKYMKALFAEVNLETNMRAMALITTCLSGPFDVGYKLLGTPGVMESMVAMTSSEEEEVQKAAIEAILSCINKASNVTFVVENGTALLKEIYKNTKTDSIKVRALVGLCKLGASHGTDVSRRVFAEGSTVKLARQCRKFLANDKKDQDLRKWAIEGLSYLSLDADVKEELSDDTIALSALYDLCKSIDKSCTYSVVMTFVNVVNAYDKNEDPLDEMKQLASFAKHHVPEEHPKDTAECAAERAHKLLKHGACAALVNLTLQETALLTASIRELISRSVLAMSHRSEDRGMIIQQGGVKMLMGFAREGTVPGMRHAAQCVARVGIQTNPQLTFPGQRSLEIPKIIKILMHIECSAVQNYEAMCCLTNLASLDEEHRRRIFKEKYIHEIESYMMEEHWELRQAATELMCNMCLYSDTVKWFEDEKYDRLKLMNLLCAEDNEKTRLAAAGALAIMCSASEKICKRIRNCCKSWLQNLSYIALDEMHEVKHRAMVILINVITHDKFAAEEIVKSEIFDIITGYASQKVTATPVVVDLALDILQLLVTEKFVEETDNAIPSRGNVFTGTVDEEIDEDDHDDGLLA